MKATHKALSRGFAKHANDQVKAVFTKTASRRWLEDRDLMKLCKLFDRKKAKKS